ncbi:MAG: bifunctional phosphopantothenoylcysteine decarboxylase/phosphopantothenate--cysteine ligase CoaBC [Acidobacteriota bacterium]
MNTSHDHESAASASSAEPLRVLLGVSGGIAAYKAAEITRQLIKAGHSVRCAMTRSAEAFLPALTLEVLSGHRVYRQEYLTATDTGEELHITAADWAQVLCIAPTTANLLGQLARGLADDFLTTTALAFEGPMVVAPAMHHRMWNHPAVKENVARLKERGALFAGPDVGALASGELGVGRLAAPEEVVTTVEEAARQGGTFGFGGGQEAPLPLAGRRVLISAGPTFEAVDPVRFLGNRSSGKMGFALAGAAAELGAQVTLVAGPVVLDTPRGVERRDVESALEMQTALHEVAPRADLVVMTAAVADYRPLAAAPEKLKKRYGIPQLELTENPDILAGLTQVAPDALRVGFAAETEKVAEHACEKLAKKGAHMIVANDVSRADIGFGHDDNEVVVYRQQEESVSFSRRPKHQLARDLMELFAEELARRAELTTASLGEA